MEYCKQELERLISTDDQDALKSFLDSRWADTRARTTFLSVIRAKKLYSALPLLPNHDEKELYSIYTDAVRDDTVHELEKFGAILFRLKVSKACGFEGVDFDLIPMQARSIWSYFHGVIEADNSKLFVQLRPLYPGDTISLVSIAAEYCAKQIMTYCGFSKKNIQFCVMHALSAKNKETLLFLRDELRDDEEIANAAFERGFLRSLQWNNCLKICYPFLVDCFNSRMITLTDEGWKELKEIDEELYNILQNDV